MSCNLGTLAAGGSATVLLNGTVAASVTGNLSNTASVTSTTPGSGASQTITTPLAGTADLALVKTATATARAGETITYTLTAYNAGPSDAASVRITDTLPGDVTFVAASSGCSNAGGVVTCVVGSLAAGASASYVITVTAASSIVPGTSLQNSAVVASSTLDGNASNNSATADTSIVGAADLTISKSGAPASVRAGDLVTYTITITNTGPGSARSVDVKDQLPAGMSLVSSGASGGGICGGAVCQFGTLAVNATRTITVVARVAANTAAGALTNTAAVYSTDEINTANDTATAATTVTTSADLSIGKTASPDPIVPGQSLTYLLTVANAGPSDAQTVVVTDTLPAGFTASSISSSQGACSALPCALGTLPAGGSATVTIIGAVAATVTTSLTNLAGVSSATSDPNPANNSASLTTGVSPSADLALALASTPTAIGGQTAMVTATVINLGPSAASGTVATLTLPPSTTFNSATLPAGWFAVDNGNGTVTLTTTNIITAGQVVNLPITVNVAAGVEPGTSLQFGGAVSSSTPDPSTTNNTANADTSVVGLADLALSKTGPASAVAGQQITYTIVVTNNGPSVAQFADIKDALPEGMSLVRASSSTGLCGGTVCQVGDIPLGGVVTMTVVGLVGADVTGVVTNTAALFAVSADPNVANNSDTVATTVTGSADLSIVKSASPNPAVPGQTLTYLLTVANAGPSNALAVVVTDTLPAGFTQTSVASSQGACSALPCTLGMVPAGGSATVTIVGTVAATVTTGLTNLAGVTSATSDPNLSNNTASLTTFTSPNADLALTKQDAPDPVLAGTRLVYTLTVRNLGPAAASDVVVTDTLPYGVSFADSSQCAETAPGSGIVTCAAAANPLPAGASAVFTLAVNVSAALPTSFSLVNQAVVGSSTADPNPANNRAVEDTEVLAVVALQVAKTSAPNPVVAGNRLTYTLVVTNSGPAESTDTRVIDTLPFSTHLVAATPSNGGICNTGILCLLGTLAVGEVVSVTIVVDVDPALRQGTVFTNTASAFSDEIQPPLPVTASSGTSIQELVDLSLQKQDFPDPVGIGGSVGYRLVVTNAGPSTAFNVVITDRLDFNTSFATASFGCMHDGSASDGLVTCVIPALAAGEQRTLDIQVAVASGLSEGTVLTNRARVTSDSHEANTLNNSTEVTTTVRSGTDLSVAKSGPAQALAGEVVVYTILVKNLGPSNASGVKVTDTLPSELVLATVNVTSSGGTCLQAGGIVTCDLGTLAYGITDTVAITISGQVAPGTVLGSTVSNAVEAGMTTLDLNPANNAAQHNIVIVGVSDLGIAKTGPLTAVAGRDSVTYTLVISNAGPSQAQNVCRGRSPAGRAHLH